MLKLTYNDMLSAYSVYPAPIRPYLLRAETHPDIRTKLTKSFMRVFIDLVARTRIRKPEKEIDVSVHKVATKLGVSTKTVTRTISLCLDSGWLALDPHHDGRNRWGKYSARRYLVATPLRELVGLPTSDADAHDNDADEITNVADASQTAPGEWPTEPATSDICDGHLETEMSHGIEVNKSFFKKEASFNKDAEKPKGLPADLRSLQSELGIELFGIFSLMALAKQVGQRLQDVWIAKRRLLLNSGVTGGRAVHYLRSLLNSGDDFAYVARKITNATGSPGTGSKASQGDGAKKRPPRASDASKTRLEAIAEACRYKTFRHINRDMIVRFYDGFAEVTRGAVRETYPECHMEGLYKGVAAGNLVEV
jgi:hypothetical protein